MARERISTTVDSELLGQARAACGGARDSSVLEQALAALIAKHRAATFDQQIDAGYRDVALDRPDEWGDLGSFLEAAGAEQDAAEPR